MKKIQITFDCPDEETYLQVLGISKSFKEKLSGFSEVNIKEISSNPKEPEAVHGNEAEKGVCHHFYKATYIGVGYVRQCQLCGDIKQ